MLRYRILEEKQENSSQAVPPPSYFRSVLLRKKQHQVLNFEEGLFKRAPVVVLD